MAGDAWRAHDDTAVLLRSHLPGDLYILRLLSLDKQLSRTIKARITINAARLPKTVRQVTKFKAMFREESLDIGLLGYVYLNGK